MTFYTFGNSTTSIPLANLDANFATPITLGNTAVTINNTYSAIGNLTLNNVTIASGNSTVTKQTVTTITSPAATALTIQSAGTTGLYIDTSQNVGIGTITPSQKLQVVATTNQISLTTGSQELIARATSSEVAVYTFQSLPMVFYNNNTERMRIDTSGNLLVGTTTASALLTVAGPASFQAPSTKTAAYSMTATDSSLIFNGTASITLTLQAASSYTGRILYVKTIAAFTVVSASSNVVPLAGGSAGTAILAATAGKWAMLQSDGTNWIIMASN